MKIKKHKVLCGADIIARDGYDFYGKCGLITNPTGVLRNLTPTVDMLNEHCNLTALFGPEHGVRGNIQAGDTVDSNTDKRTGLPVYSLYGNQNSRSEDILTSLDTIIFDIQDVGARFYTYAYTMTDSMKLCAKNGIRFVVLDRPNPLGGIKTEGTILDRNFSSFVGRFPTPTRSGLTIGEFAKMMNDTEKIDCKLTVIPMDGWSRELYFDDTDLVFIPPSPNMPTIDTAFAYVGTCIFEGTNISEGRGTTKPFEIIGAPWLDSAAVLNLMDEQDGVIFRECSFIPTFSKYQGELCNGIQLHITHRDVFSPFEVGIKLLTSIRKTHNQFEMKPFISNLLGTDEIFSEEFDADSFIEREKEKIKAWKKQAEQWKLY